MSNETDYSCYGGSDPEPETFAACNGFGPERCTVYSLSDDLADADSIAETDLVDGDRGVCVVPGDTQVGDRLWTADHVWV